MRRVGGTGPNAIPPTTGTIGDMVQFYIVFHFSTPYVPFVPLNEPEGGLFVAARRSIRP